MVGRARKLRNKTQVHPIELEERAVVADWAVVAHSSSSMKPAPVGAAPGTASPVQLHWRTYNHKTETPARQEKKKKSLPNPAFKRIM